MLRAKWDPELRSRSSESLNRAPKAKELKGNTPRATPPRISVRSERCIRGSEFARFGNAPISSQDGFTLIEIIVVLVILGLMLGVIVMRGPTRSQRLDLDMATRDLAGSLRMARSRAIAQNRPVAMQVGPGSYSLDGEPPHRLAALVMAGSGAIGFAPSGASSGGTIILRAGTREAAIQVDWLTGRVSVTHGR